jgi:hypothetical protein
MRPIVIMLVALGLAVGAWLYLGARRTHARSAINFYTAKLSLNGPTPEPISLRQLGRDCAAAAPGLGVERGAALLQGVRGMAKRVASAQPRASLWVLTGISLLTIADRGLVQLYPAGAQTAAARKAAQLQAADQAWEKQARAILEAERAQLDLANPDRFISRYGITNGE